MSGPYFSFFTKRVLEAELTTLSKPATNATCKEANIRSGFLQALLSSTLEIYWGGGGYLEYEPGAPVCCSWRQRWVSQLAHCRNSGRLLTAPRPQVGLEGRMAGQRSDKSNKKPSPRPLEACSKRVGDQQWLPNRSQSYALPRTSE